MSGSARDRASAASEEDAEVCAAGAGAPTGTQSAMGKDAAAGRDTARGEAGATPGGVFRVSLLVQGRPADGGPRAAALPPRRSCLAPRYGRPHWRRKIDSEGRQWAGRDPGQAPGSRPHRSRPMADRRSSGLPTAR